MSQTEASQSLNDSGGNNSNASTASTLLASATTAWTRCATENQTCSFSGTKQVRYGANGTYALKTATGSIGCNNTVFGDPVPGVQKACDYTDTTSTTTPATSTSTSSTASWTRCATENQTCSFSGTKQVRYGANGTYAFKTATGSIACNNTVFGDPAPGVVKACDYTDSTSTSTSTPSTSTSTPSTSTSSTMPSTRDPLKWPFASNSIWNMPIGSGAVYVPANLSGNPGGDTWAPMPQVDDEILVLTPTAPATTINYSDAGWSGKDRCGATGGMLFQAPIPSGYVVPNSGANSAASFLMSDGRTIVQTQPFARCSAGGSATSMVKFNPVDIYGTGMSGAHGGSGLSAIGGSLRIGELRPGGQGPRHALKVNVYAAEALYKCTSYSSCYRWPATNADSYAVGRYGTASNSSNTAMKMGALLAIPASVNLSNLGLETEPGRQLAWTLQNYGAYIVDDTWGPAFALNAETGPNGSFRTQFKADWGFDLEQRVNNNSPWVRDIQRLVKALHVVDNNSSTNIGGGGTPRQPLAPSLQ